MSDIINAALFIGLIAFTIWAFRMQAAEADARSTQRGDNAKLWESSLAELWQGSVTISYVSDDFSYAIALNEPRAEIALFRHGLSHLRLFQ